MDKSQRRLSRKAKNYRASRFGLVTVPAFAVSAASYIVIETGISWPLSKPDEHSGLGPDPETDPRADDDSSHANGVARNATHRRRTPPRSTKK